MSKDSAPSATPRAAFPAASSAASSDQLAALRARFDVVDDAIIALVLERQALADEAGRIKANAGLPVVDGVREAEAERRRLEVVRRTLSTTQTPKEGSAVDAAVVVDVFAALVAASRARQELRR